MVVAELATIYDTLSLLLCIALRPSCDVATSVCLFDPLPTVF